MPAAGAVLTGPDHTAIVPGAIGMTLLRPDSDRVDLMRPSPNHGMRIGYARPDSIILHYTGMADGPSAIAWLCNPASQVSSHYVVEADGTILQLVAEERRAWHAGRSGWMGETDINSASIGIEIVNGGHPAGLPSFPPVQIDAVTQLSRDIAARHGIRPERILAHSDVSPGRKCDPGERFPWHTLFACGIGHWVPEMPGTDEDELRPGDRGPAVLGLQQAMLTYGYALDASGEYDDRTRIVIEAFQRHFRPSVVTGIADAGTRATLAALISALPSPDPTGSAPDRGRASASP